LPQANKLEKVPSVFPGRDFLRTCRFFTFPFCEELVFTGRSSFLLDSRSSISYLVFFLCKFRGPLLLSPDPHYKFTPFPLGEHLSDHTFVFVFSPFFPRRRAFGSPSRPTDCVRFGFHVRSPVNFFFFVYPRTTVNSPHFWWF